MSNFVKEETVKKTAKIEWNSSPEIRAEFPSFETFLAYKMAVASGDIKVSKKVK